MIRHTTILLMVACSTAAFGSPKAFVDRLEPTDLRVVSYNVMWDHNFPDVDPIGAQKFARVAKAIDADIWCLQEIKKKSAQDVVALMNTVAPLGEGATWHAYKGWTNVIVSKYPLRATGDKTQPPGQRELAYAVVDLPDARFDRDLYVLNNHWKCCGGKKNDPKRQRQADAITNWIRAVRSANSGAKLPADTPIVICGDFNLVGANQPLQTVLTGDIFDETTYGKDFGPDWDGTSLTDACPAQNASTPQYYTWRNDGDKYEPGRIDFVIYSDSVMTAVHSYVLNTTSAPEIALRSAGLQRYDVCHDDKGAHFDHMPVVVDFRLIERKETSGGQASKAE